MIEGHLVIDLINTEEFRRGVRRDLIRSPQEFVAWLSEEELAGAISRVQLPFDIQVWTVTELSRVHAFRAHLRERLEQMADRQEMQMEIISEMESYMEQAPFVLKIHDEKVTPVPIGDPVQRLCSLVAADLLHLFEIGHLSRLRRCSNPNCLFLYIDPAGRRKWCSMKRCGNRAKVTRHLRRRRKERYL
jgi:predicted RNA-binding Zn ribbon-like protein